MIYPSIDTLKHFVSEIRDETFNRPSSPEEVLTKTFILNSENDPAFVFHFLTNDWFEFVYSKIQNVVESGYYDEDTEHKIAYITVNLNLLHSLSDGNKRTGLLVMFVLLITNGLDKALEHGWGFYYKFAKKIASDGTVLMKENIEKLAIALRGESVSLD